MLWWCSNLQPLDYKLSTLAIELYCSKCFCWEGVEFIQLVYCIIIYLSFLNCDWLLIREVQWFSWYQQRNLQWGCRWWDPNSQLLDYKPSALVIELYTSKCFCWEGCELIQLVYCIILYLSFLNGDWLLIREVQWFYWTQELLVPVEKFTVRMLMVRLELANLGLQTQCSSHWAIQLKSYCWEVVEFIQLLYYIIIYLSVLNCDCLLIREVQWLHWTQELLVPVKKFTVRMSICETQTRNP